MPGDGNSTREGVRAFRRGEYHRRLTVERALVQLMLVKAIPVWITDCHGDTREANDGIRAASGLSLDSRQSALHLQDVEWFAETDALALLDALDDQCAWKTNVSVNDWLIIERLVRERIESRGLPDTKEALFEEVTGQLRCFDPSASEPNRADTLRRISLLFEEYAESEN